VQCAVEFAVAASVEAVADRLAGRGRDRCCAGEPGEGCFGGDASSVRPGEDELCGGVRSNAWLFEQVWCEFAGDRFDLPCELAFLGGQLQHPAGDRAQREQAAAQLRIAVTGRSCRCEAAQELCACQRPQLAAQRLRCRDQ
jgi:hypothetical protein